MTLRRNADIPTMLSKKAPRRCQSFLSLRKVIMWDKRTSLAFWRPKKTHKRVIPLSISVCFTIFSGSLSNVTTFCWTISCKAWSSEPRREGSVFTHTGGNFTHTRGGDFIHTRGWGIWNLGILVETLSHYVAQAVLELAIQP